MAFYGREKETIIFNDLLLGNNAKFAVVRGRRRIGKTRFLKTWAKKHQSYYFQGLPPADNINAQAQRDEFSRQYQEYFQKKLKDTSDWGTIFSNLAKKCSKKQVIIILDEISWMGDKDPTFLGKIKIAWDEYWSQNPNLVLVLCGSVSQWIEKNILTHTGFMGRISLDFVMQELELQDCAKFWGTQKKNISSFEKFKLLSVTGGIPRYLEEINPKKSSEENITQMCFHSGGLLFREYDQIFNHVFLKKSDIYQKILKILIFGTKNYQELLDELNYKKGGNLALYLSDLIQAGFIKKEHSWNLKTLNPSRIAQYRCCDNYIRFYLKYISPYKEQIYRWHTNQLPGFVSLKWSTIMGLQFENLVLNNRRLVYKELNLSNNDIVMDNPYHQRQTKSHYGCQIDLLIQSQFQTFYVCEIKFSKNRIGKNIINEVQNKITALKKSRGQSFRPVLIHVNGVSDEVEESGYFSNIIEFGDFII